jgi:phage baseplate assembly protein V
MSPWRQFAAMEDEEDMHGLIGQLIRKGVIQSVDLGAGLAVIKIGEIPSPPLPWVEGAAGAFRTWTPPSDGEQVLLLCPEGDIEGGIIMRGLLSNQYPAPASDAYHSIHGSDGLIITITNDGLVVTAPAGVVVEGDVSISGNVSVTGDITASGTVTGDADVVGGGVSLKSHKHSGVQAGGASTGGPQ